MDAHDPAASPILVGQALIIEGEKISVKYQEMTLEDVRLDPNNPRIQHAVKRKSNGRPMSQSELRDLILDLPEYPNCSSLYATMKGFLNRFMCGPTVESLKETAEPRVI
jgi:hypothetical protein